MAKGGKSEEKDTTTQQDKQKQPQDLFGQFVETCIIGKKALITEYNGALFTNDNLAATIQFYQNAKENINQGLIKKIFNGEAFQNGNISYDASKKDEIIHILLHCYWLLYLGGDKANVLKIEEIDKNAEVKYVDNIDIFKTKKILWATGVTFSNGQYGSILFILNLIKGFINQSCNQIDDENVLKTKIEDYCKKEDNANNAIANIILYFCDSQKYLPIVARNAKETIVRKFSGLIQDSTEDDVDAKLLEIKNVLNSTLLGEKTNDDYVFNGFKLDINNPFWHPNIMPFWQDTNSSLKGELSLEDLLEYKKALVLYGPPGTSKSYSAREIAKHIIARNIRKNEIKKEDIEKFDETCDTHIHTLQFHPNYTYDDFIVGKTIKDNSVNVEKGWLLKLIDEINDDINDTLPHVVILDEINRVDISRVFGELLTAMEPAYRGKGVVLPVKELKDLEKNGPKKEKEETNGDIKLIVPENMYFIGTMNQIDFSLEQVDFALRRRFIWQLSTYNKDALKEIIDYKIKEANNKEQTLVIQDEWVSAYCSQCTSLNNIIRDNENLGESFWIGHTYFAEIIDIYIQINAKADKKWDAAKNVLWQISIKPTLEAYCGTMDTTKQQEFINKCLGAFKLTESATEPDSNDEESE